MIDLNKEISNKRFFSVMSIYMGLSAILIISFAWQNVFFVALCALILYIYCILSCFYLMYGD